MIGADVNNMIFIQESTFANSLGIKSVILYRLQGVQKRKHIFPFHLLEIYWLHTIMDKGQSIELGMELA